MPRTEYNVSPEDFVRAWQSSKTAQEVAAKLAMPKPLVHARASNYRRIGVRLKLLGRGNPKRLDVQALNKLIQQTEETGTGRVVGEVERALPA
jgi:hypothetical protein